jgi:transcriptional regulator
MFFSKHALQKLEPLATRLKDATSKWQEWSAKGILVSEQVRASQVLTRLNKQIVAVDAIKADIIKTNRAELTAAEQNKLASIEKSLVNTMGLYEDSMRVHNSPLSAGERELTTAIDKAFREMGITGVAYSSSGPVVVGRKGPSPAKS